MEQNTPEKCGKFSKDIYIIRMPEKEERTLCEEVKDRSQSPGPRSSENTKKLQT